MTELMQLYKCDKCGNIVEIVHPGSGELVCCGLPMILLKEHTNDDEMNEKHVPVYSFEDGKKMIRVGSFAHPMDDNHFIMFIEAISPDKKYLKRKYLSPHEVAELELKCDCAKIEARELCNVHGLWRSQNYE